MPGRLWLICTRTSPSCEQTHIAANPYCRTPIYFRLERRIGEAGCRNASARTIVLLELEKTMNKAMKAMKTAGPLKAMKVMMAVAMSAGSGGGNLKRKTTKEAKADIFILS